jgi:SAM-dependent methyltransferase
VTFKDHFSRVARDYQQYRPRYPPELAAHLAALSPRRELALDLATGNGQAAVDLAVHFERVLASDASAGQLAHAEARRVLRPRGVVALWAYGPFRIDDEIDRRVHAFYDGVVGPYWPPERRYIETGYRTLPFPLAELPAPQVAFASDWTLQQVISYVGTWSAVDRYRAANGADPVPRLAADLAPLWPDAGTRRVEWPIHLRLGRV